MKLIFKDLPEHGLVLTDPFDPFSEKNTDVWMRRFALIADCPEHCIALLNESKHRVIAYKMVWHLKTPTGSTHVDEKSFANIGELMGLRSAINHSGIDASIEPGSFHMFSLTDRMRVEIGRESTHGIRASVGGVSLSKFAEAESYVQMTVMVDGVFFDDGTFVGPDETAYFERVQAQVNAKFDLLQDIVSYAKLGKPLTELFATLTTKARPKYGANMTPQQVYDLYKAIFAEEAQALKNAYGDSSAMHEWLKDLEREWPNLRKAGV